MSSRTVLAAITALASGIVFGVGLAIAQMINPRKVLAFLDVAGAWDASLMFVLGGAVVTAAVGYYFILKRKVTLLGEPLRLSASKSITRPLVVGSALFGIGWGLAGYCPGPAIASLGFGNPEALWIVPAMLLGVLLHRVQLSVQANMSSSGKSAGYRSERDGLLSE